MKTRPKTPVIEELRIMASAAAYWANVEPDEENPTPFDSVRELATDIDDTLESLPPCYDCAPLMVEILKRLVARAEHGQIPTPQEMFVANQILTCAETPR